MRLDRRNSEFAVTLQRMAGSRTTFEKMQRDRAKKAKADAKRAKRLGRTPDGRPLEVEADPDNAVQLDGNLDKEIGAADLIRLVEELQRSFDNDEISFDEYEERKIELLARLPTD